MGLISEYLRQVARYDWWGVAIELILIGLVVYWVVEFLEGTRGERLFRGTLFLLVAGVVVLKLIAERFGLERLQYLYNGFLIFVLIIAVAAFQPEIRRALIRTGQPKFLTHSSQRLAIALEEIISAVMELSVSRVGAIIVIEKRVALGEFVETGVKIDAMVGSELLRAIFKPNAPLHDMAVIVRGDRIISARVQLPLAEVDSVNGIELGSRHRAAIGITNSSDATVIVVSEETGIVSVAEDGKLTRGITESQLRKQLTSNIEVMASSIERFWPFPASKKSKEKVTEEQK
ncbi:MAG: diadenylate cyclase CdaA [Planctomycetota bacterium]